MVKQNLSKIIKILVGGIIVSGIAIGCCNNSISYIAQFIDRNNNGLYDGYKIVKKIGKWTISCSDTHLIWFNTQFGGAESGEFCKERLIAAYNAFHTNNSDKSSHFLYTDKIEFK